MSIADLRTAFHTIGTGVIVAGTKIRGTVISDSATANINFQNLILQDGHSGIIVRFLAANTVQMNDSIEIDISGDSLITYQSGLELSEVPIASVTHLGTGSVTPNVVTASYVLANLATLESTLIKTIGATLSGGTSGTYKASVNVNDATGSYIMYTRTAATFSGTTYPTGTVSVTGFLSNFNGIPELILRDPAIDVY